MNRLLFLVLASMFLASPACALEFFKAELVANAGTGSSATGIASLVLDEASAEVTYDISVTGLGSAEIGAHIHAPDGSILLQLPPGESKSGVWTDVGLPQIFQLRNGGLYILIHTEDAPGGEVRGDIVAGKVPVEDPSFGRLKARFSDE